MNLNFLREAGDYIVRAPGVKGRLNGRQNTL